MRRTDLDWLRIGATFLLFPFHVAKVFDTRPIYHLENERARPAARGGARRPSDALTAPR